MKLFGVVLLLAALISADAFVRWRSPPACVDCYGRRQWPGARYFDGCNWCTCSGPWWRPRAACTRMACYENRCFKRYNNYNNYNNYYD